MDTIRACADTLPLPALTRGCFSGTILRNVFFALFFVIHTGVVFSQATRQANELLQASGYYKLLQAYDPKPAPGYSPLDTLRFVFLKSTVDGILALKPFYLGLPPEYFVLPEPPANSSAQTRAELNFLLNLQNQRSRLDIESSKVMADIFYPANTSSADTRYEEYRKNLFHIGRSVGTWFNPAQLPLTAELFANVCKDATYYIWHLKMKYARIRPYVLESELENLEETDWAAYPSGHASNAYISAYILLELAPESADIFLRDAFEMTRSREILGVHYPSDGESARIFARQFVDALFKNEAFLADFERVQAEWKERSQERFEKPTGLKAAIRQTAGAPAHREKRISHSTRRP